MVRLLLAEDEKRMAEALKQHLLREGYAVTHVPDGIAALQAVLSGQFDLIVLDVLMPGMDGYAVAAAARREGIRTPILMLSARSELDDKVEGLDSGADDYLTKPFMTRELLARLRALQRRTGELPEQSPSPELPAFGDICLHPGTMSLACTKNSLTVRLSEKEYRILAYMIANGGQILTREQLAVRVWGYDSEAEYNNVEVYMSFTRKKLAFVEAETEIKAVRGIGYTLRYRDVQ